MSDKPISMAALAKAAKPKDEVPTPGECNLCVSYNCDLHGHPEDAPCLLPKENEREEGAGE